MRDLVVTSVIFATLPFILLRPWIGILVWCWLSYMNPHRLSWGFATTMPFALIVALTTFTGMLMMREPKRIPWTRETITLLLLSLWMVVTTVFALNQEGAWAQLSKVAKIQLMTFATLMLINTPQRLRAMVWMIAMSLGYFGIKGGLFTIMTGGSYRVWGPEGTFIGGNNEIALALIMVLPLLRFLQLDAKQAWMRWALGGAMFLCAVAAIGSHSRGAMLAIIAMATFLWLKSRNKLTLGLLVGFTLAAILAIMPSEYYERMGTVQNYQLDGSALGRINAWWMAWNLAVARPLVGGGFEVFVAWIFPQYAPEPENVHDVHSIYFEMLGEHGFVGLGLFLLLWWFSWSTASRLNREVRGDPERKWLGDLALMVQVGLVGYAVGGVFLGLAYFDLPYHLMTMIVIAQLIARTPAGAPALNQVPQAGVAAMPAMSPATGNESTR